MAIQGTIKFVNPAKFSDKTQKWSQSIKVAVPGQPDAVIYGAFAVLPIFLLWVYVSWVVVLMGATLVAVLSEGDA